MFHCRELNNRINKMHQRALRLVYKDNNKLTFNDLWELDNSVTTHKRNFQILATDIFEVKSSFAPEVLKQKNLITICVLALVNLTHYRPMCCLFAPPENIRKTKGLLMFSGGIDK